MAPLRVPVRRPDGTVGAFVLMPTASESVEPGAFEVNRILDAIRQEFPHATEAHAIDAHEYLLFWRGLSAEWGSENAQRKRARQKLLARELATIRRKLEPCTDSRTTTPEARKAAAMALWEASDSAWNRIMLEWVSAAGVAPLFTRDKWTGSRGWNPRESQRARRDPQLLADKPTSAKAAEEADVEFEAAVLELVGGREVIDEKGRRVKLRHFLTPLRARRLYECADPEKGRPEDVAEHALLCSLALLWWRLASKRPTLTTGRVRGTKGNVKNGTQSRFERFVRAIESAADEPRPAVTRTHLERVVPLYSRNPRPTE